MKTRTGMGEDGHEYRRLFCPYCRHPFREADAEWSACRFTECTAACSGKTAITGEKR